MGRKRSALWPEKKDDVEYLRRMQRQHRALKLIHDQLVRAQHRSRRVANVNHGLPGAGHAEEFCITRTGGDLSGLVEAVVVRNIVARIARIVWRAIEFGPNPNMTAVDSSSDGGNITLDATWAEFSGDSVIRGSCGIGNTRSSWGVPSTSCLGSTGANSAVTSTSGIEGAAVRVAEIGIPPRMRGRSARKVAIPTIRIARWNAIDPSNGIARWNRRLCQTVRRATCPAMSGQIGLSGRNILDRDESLSEFACANACPESFPAIGADGVCRDQREVVGMPRSSSGSVVFDRLSIPSIERHRRVPADSHAKRVQIAQALTCGGNLNMRHNTFGVGNQRS